MASYQYLKTSGVIVADTEQTLTTVQEEYKSAFGDDLVVTPDTPQGVLITAETLARDAVIRNNAALANQINPNIAGGVFLDAIMALTGSVRDAAERSFVSATLTGVPNTIIPAGVRAATNPEGDEFELVSTVVLDLTGLAVGEFQSVEYGAIPAAAGDLTDIVSGVLGWENITNATDATLGRAEQSDQAARTYRRNTLAIQGQSVAESITSGLYAVDNVRSLQFRENITNATATIDGISLVAHSVWACVDGGTDIDVASMLLRKKAAGANFNGGTEIVIRETFSGQDYSVKFERPTSIPVQAKVTIRQNSQVPDPVASIKAAILAYANGQIEGETGFSVGNDVSPYEIGGAVNRQYPEIFVSKVEVSLASPTTWTTDSIVIALDEIATITSGAITVVVS